MAIEIERKFLVISDAWRAAVVATRRLRQFYLAHEGKATVRVRIEGEERAWLTIKSAVPGVARHEFEYPLPPDDARSMLALAEGAVIDKVRHIVPFAGHDWEVDVFGAANTGLVVAEVELAAVDTAPQLPPWVGDEVTADKRYYNASLSRHPFSSW